MPMKNLAFRRNIVFRTSQLLCLLFLFSLNLSAQCSITGSTEVCLSNQENYILDYDVPPGGMVNWSIGAQGVIVSSNNDEATINWLYEGVSTINVLVYDQFSNEVANCALDVNINGIPEPTMSTDIFGHCSKSNGELSRIFTWQLCEGEIKWVSALGESNSTFEFSVTDNLSILGSNTANPVQIQVGSPGEGTICVIETTENGCESEELCYEIDVNELPVASFEVNGFPDGCPLDVCVDQQLTFVNTSPDPDANGQQLVYYYWEVFNVTQNTIISSGAENLNFTFSIPGTYEVSLVVANECSCTSLPAICEIIVNDLPSHEIVCPSIICEGEEETYSTPSNCPVYEWTFMVDNTVVHTDVGNPVTYTWDNIPLGFSGFGTVILETPGCNDFCDGPSIATVPILPNYAEIDGLTTLCANNFFVTYSLPNWPGASYQWYVNGNIPPDSDEHELVLDYIYLATLNGAFTVSVEVSHNIVDCDFVSELECYRSDLNFPYPPPGCFGEDFELELTSSSFPPNYEIDWEVYLPSGGLAYSGTSVNSPVITVPGSAITESGGYYVSYSMNDITNGILVDCPTNSYFYIYNEVPTPECVNGPDLVCVGESYIYTICNPQAGVVYEWDITGGTVDPMEGNSVLISWTQASPQPSLTVTATQAYGSTICESEPITIFPDVQDNLVIEILGNTNPVEPPITEPCVDNVVDYYASISGLGSYQWYIEPPHLGTIVSGENDDVVSVLWHYDPLNSLAALKLEVSGCNAEPVSLAIDIQTAPDFEVNHDPDACVDESTIFSASILNGDNYQWVFGDGESTSNSSPVVFHSYDTPGTYFGTVTVEVTDDSDGCAGTFTTAFSIVVHENPVAYITSPDPKPCQADCENSFFSMTLFTEFFPDYTYQWLQNGVPIPGATSSSYTVTNDPSTNLGWGSYTVEVSDEYCTVISSVYEVFCNCEPVPPCEKPLLRLEIQSVDLLSNSCGLVQVTSQIYPDWSLVALAQYVIEDPTGAVGPIVNIDIGGPNPFTHFFQFVEPGYYPFQMEVVDVNGCLYIESGLIIVPHITDFYYTIDCINDNTEFEYTFNNSTESIPGAVVSIDEWSVNSGSEGNADPLVINLESGSPNVVCLSVSSSLNGINYTCKYCEELVVPTEPTAEFVYEEDQTCEGQLIGFTALADPNDILNYYWEFGDGSASFLANPFKEYISAGTYNVSLTIETVYGCSETRTLPVTVSPNELDGQLEDLLNECASSAELSFNQTSGEMIVSWLWSNGSTGSTLYVVESGSYSVTVTDANGCEFASDPINLLLDNPLGNGISGTTVGCAPANLYLNVPFNQDYTFEWEILGTGITGMGSWFNVFNLEAGNYTVVVEAYNSSGVLCVSASTELTVHPEVPTPQLELTYTCDPFSAVIESDVEVSWNFNGTNYGIGNSINVFAGGQVWATITDPLSGCSTTATLLIDGPIDFGPFLGGCYSECEGIINGTYCIPGIPGSYDAWRWVKLPNQILLSGDGEVEDYCPTLMDEGKIVLEIDHTYTNSDGTTIFCTERSAPFCLVIDCDDCELDINYTVECNDRFSVDPSDDFWTVIWNVNGGPSTSWSGVGPMNPSGTYGVDQPVWMGLISDYSGTVSYVIDDLDMAPYCPTEVEIQVPEPCSPDCYTIEPVISECNDNGTPNDPFDDYYTVSVIVTGVQNNMGFQIWMNNSSNILGSGDSDGVYDLGQFDMSEPNWFLKVHANDYWDCQPEVLIEVPDPCPCKLTIIADPYCDDRNSVDPSDDFMWVNVTVTDAPSGQWEMDGQIYNNNEVVQVWIGEIDEQTGPITIDVDDSLSDLCHTETLVPIPPSCSPECIDLEIITGPCKDNGTPGDPSDDYYEYTIIITNPSGLYWELEVDNQYVLGGSGNLNQGFVANISDGVLFVDINAVDYWDCYKDGYVFPPDPCSNECDIKAKTFEMVCDDAGTPLDPSDDTWSFVLVVEGPSGQQWYADSPVNMDGFYNEFVFIDMGLISDYPNGYIEFVVYDVNDPDCKILVKVEVPKPCSDECFKYKIDNIVCYDNGTKDPNDDTWSFDIYVEGPAGQQWYATDPVNQGGPFNSLLTIDMGLILNNPSGVIEFILYDINNPHCKERVKVELPKTCSEECKPELEVKIGDCEDNGTPDNPSDDYYVVSVSSLTEFECLKVFQIIDGASIYLTSLEGFASDVQLGIFSIERGCWRLEFIDCNDEKCVKSFLICPPEPCSEDCGEEIIVYAEDLSAEVTEFGTEKSYNLSYKFEVPSGFYLCPGESILTGNGFLHKLNIVTKGGLTTLSGVYNGSNQIEGTDCIEVPLCPAESETSCGTLLVCPGEDAVLKKREQVSLENNLDFNLYPNPVHNGGKLIIEFNNSLDAERMLNYRIMDMLGNLIQTGQTIQTGTQATIELKPDFSGLYYLSIEYDQKVNAKIFSIF